ncbi:MAG TPA: hypothetical protein VGK33_05630 [Chloroflexota bacterium]
MSRQDVRPIFWLVVGLLVSYLYTRIVTGLFAIELPLPLFVPQAVILSVLLLTPARGWWLYLLIYYVMQVFQGMWQGRLRPCPLAPAPAPTIPNGCSSSTTTRTCAASWPACSPRTGPSRRCPTVRLPSIRRWPHRRQPWCSTS